MHICSTPSWFLFFFIAHAIQGILYLILRLLPNFHATLIPVVISVPNGKPGSNTTQYDNEILFNADPLAMMVFVFFVTSIAHFFRFLFGKPFPEWEQMQKKMKGKGDSDDDEDDDQSDSESNGLNKPSMPNEREKDLFVKVDKHLSVQRKIKYAGEVICVPVAMMVVGLQSGLSDLYGLAAVGFLGGMGGVLLSASTDMADHYSEKLSVFMFSVPPNLILWIIVLAQLILLAVRVGGATIPYSLATAITLLVISATFIISDYMYVNTYHHQEKNMPRAVMKRDYIEFANVWLIATRYIVLGILTAASCLQLA